MSSGESDTDIVGVVMNPRADFFQNERGYINGFGPPPKSFTTWQSHHNVDSGVEYDITVYGLANWFDLMANSNPNMVELLWIPVHCIRVNTLIAQHVRANRKMFLSKNAKHKFIGYAYAQLKKIDNKDPKGKRAQLVAAHGFDTKFLAHLVRLTLEAEQILQEGDIDLMKNSELLKGIRRGEWTEEQGRAWFSEKEKYLEKLYQESALQHSVDMDAIRNLLVECIEMHYGSVDKVLKIEGKNDKILRQIKDLLDKADL
jgi:predicted nucleotidyltransferase